MTMLETKKPTIHAVGRASRAAQRPVRCPDLRRDLRPVVPAGSTGRGAGRVASWVATSARLHFGPDGCAPLHLVGSEEPEDVGVLEVLQLDVAGGGGLCPVGGGRRRGCPWPAWRSSRRRPSPAWGSRARRCSSGRSPAGAGSR